METELNALQMMKTTLVTQTSATMFTQVVFHGLLQDRIAFRWVEIWLQYWIRKLRTFLKTNFGSLAFATEGRYRYKL